jgi:ATP-dependent RNA helicase DDX19/DBP5
MLTARPCCTPLLLLPHSCPLQSDKVGVLREMIFPNCEKLGQTIIFVRMKETSRQLHKQLQDLGYKITSIQVGVGGRVC